MRNSLFTLTVLLIAGGLLAGCSGVRYASAPPLAFQDIDYGFPTERALEAPQIAYIDEGQGAQTILLVHGLASNAGFWRYSIPLLANAGYRVIAVDLPGFGKSDKGAYPYDMTFYANTLSRFIRALDLGPVIYAGHSMGGQIGITLALEEPALIDQLVLVAPAGIEPFGPGESAWLANVLTVDGITNAPEEAIRANLALNFHRWDPEWEWMVEERARMARTPEMNKFSYAVLRSVHGMLDEPTTARLPEVTVPTLIVYGQYDRLIPNQYLHPGFPRDVFQAGADAIPDAELIEIPNAGHMIQIERPQEFVDAVLRYLGGPAAAGR
jgi:pimeloyl-ACP methyl ester carboxylesterase